MTTFNYVHPPGHQFLPIVYPPGNVKKNGIGGGTMKSSEVGEGQIQGSEMGESEVDGIKVCRKLEDKR